MLDTPIIIAVSSVYLGPISRISRMSDEPSLSAPRESPIAVPIREPINEATIANLVRAYITVKTHPALTRVRLKGGRLSERKEGYAEWQLLEIL